MKSTAIAAALLAVVPSALAVGKCLCGYTVNQTDTEHFGLFTDMMETDFLHAPNVTEDDVGSSDWHPRVSNITAGAGVEEYGQTNQLGNLIANPLPDEEWGGPAATPGDAGLQLWVRSEKVDGVVPVAQVEGPRNDMIYGSFRAAIKFTGLNGTAGRFFWARKDNDREMIDMEFLSRDRSTVELLVGRQGSDIKNEAYQSILELPQKFHEYRFDWMPDRVDFYIDGTMIHTMTEDVPQSKGYIGLSHYSNGKADWTNGPPLQDAVMTVSYIKTYFNTTTRDEPNKGCTGMTLPNSICDVPPQLTPPNPDGNMTFWWSLAEPDHGKNPIGNTGMGAANPDNAVKSGAQVLQIFSPAMIGSFLGCLTASIWLGFCF